MNKFWNKTTAVTLGGLAMLSLLVASFYLSGGLPARPLYNYALIIIAAAIVVIAVVYIILAAKGKIHEKESDWRQFFILGVIWLILGLPHRNKSLIILGLVFLALGLINRKKWRGQPKWSELPPAKRRIKLAMIILSVLLIPVSLAAWYLTAQNKPVVTDFTECAAAGYPVMESYPRQCRAGDKTFTEIVPVGNDKIQVSSPLPGAIVKSPLRVMGEARGNWYFEASFPMRLFDGNGKELAVVPVQALGEWMTTDFVPFDTIIVFEAPQTDTGTLVLEKDNPSGLPQNADSISVPVRFK